MSIPLLKGRMFSNRDIMGSVPVIATNEAFARKYFKNEDPLHKRIGFGLKPEWREIVGVVADVKQFGLDKDAKAEAYVPYQQDPWPSMTLVVRSNLDRQRWPKPSKTSYGLSIDISPFIRSRPWNRL